MQQLLLEHSVPSHTLVMYVGLVDMLQLLKQDFYVKPKGQKSLCIVKKNTRVTTIINYVGISLSAMHGLLAT